MVEKRKRHRRRFIPVTQFSRLTQQRELIQEERRMLPTRRVNDIEVKEPTCVDFIAELH